MRNGMIRRCGWRAGLFTVFCFLALGLMGFGGVAQSLAPEPASVGRATNLRASTVSQEDGSVRLTWTAADDAQVHFVVYLKSSDLEARNFGQVQMVPFAGTEGVISGLEGGHGLQFHRDWDALELGRELWSGVGQLVRLGDRHARGHDHGYGYGTASDGATVCGACHELGDQHG